MKKSKSKVAVGFMLTVVGGVNSASAETVNNFVLPTDNNSIVVAGQLNSFITPIGANEMKAAVETMLASIIRTRDGRNITASNAVYPNDRVARGEGYVLNIKYTTDTVPDFAISQTPGSNFYKVKVVQVVDGRVAETRYYHNYTKYSTVFQWAGTVSTNPAFRNVYFHVYNDQNRLVQSVRLPIGSY